MLIALDAPPQPRFADATPEILRGPFHVVDNFTGMSRAYDSWRNGVLDDDPPITFRVPSAVDPLLAPVGKAVLTATVSAVPARLFDGEWTHEKREGLAALVIAAADRVFPGILSTILRYEILLAPDFDNARGVSFGDLDGGELSPDQALSHRPFPGWDDGRTPVRGLYLGGPSNAAAPFFTGLSGFRAASSVILDIGARRHA